MGTPLLRYLLPRETMLDIGFHNFHNAITACYLADENFTVLRANERLRALFTSSEKIEGRSILALLNALGVERKEIDRFKEQMLQKGWVLIPEINLVVAGEPRIYSLLSTKTEFEGGGILNGIQGQLIDRTEEHNLRREQERLLEQTLQDQQVIKEKNEQLEGLAIKLAKYLSPQVYNSIFSGRKEVNLAFERKRLTIFFSDIEKFTDLTDGMEPEQLAELINNYFNEMSQIALEHGGTIDKYIGDALMVFFGDPDSRGDKEDALACLRMAIDMRNRMIELRAQWQSKGIGQPLHIRMGINTGHCTVGNFGSEDRLDYTILGGNVNLASRLQTSTEADSILISEETRNLVREHIKCEEHKMIEMKGLARPVKTYQVVDLYENLENEFAAINEEMGGLSLTLMPSDVQDPSAVLGVLRRAVDQVEKKLVQTHEDKGMDLL